MSQFSKIRVGVLRGGPSNEYEVSLKTGNCVLNNLPDKYFPIDIFVDKNGIWHIDGFPILPERVVKKVDVIFNAMHGEYGEDGDVQNILESLGVPYTGPKSLGALLSMNKLKAKDIAKRNGINTPIHIEVRDGDSWREKILDIFRKIHLPSFVKPKGTGSSVGTSIVGSFGELEKAIENALRFSDSVIIEEYIKGMETTCGVIDNFRGQDIYALFPSEIRFNKDKRHFDYDDKLSDKTLIITSTNLSKTEKERLQEFAKLMHRELNLRHYSRSDFIVHPKRGIYYLETNSLPGLFENTTFPKSLEAIGTNLPDFLDHILTLAIEGK